MRKETRDYTKKRRGTRRTTKVSEEKTVEQVEKKERKKSYSGDRIKRKAHYHTGDYKLANRDVIEGEDRSWSETAGGDIWKSKGRPTRSGACVSSPYYKSRLFFLTFHKIYLQETTVISYNISLKLTA